DAAPVIFEAGAYVWWAAALQDDAYEGHRIDSLLGVAIARARAQPSGPAREFWLATALGYRARQRDVEGHSWSAAKDGKAMRDGYRRVLQADSGCVDCYLGLRSEEHTSELQSRENLVCRLLLEKKKK